MSLRKLGRICAREIYKRRHKASLEALGPEHGQTRALLGRLRVYTKVIPQKDSRSVEAVAWQRESGGILIWNRSARRHNNKDKTC